MATCETCRFWRKDQPQYTYGFCKRYPPVAGFTFNVKPGKWGEGGEATVSRHAGATEFPNVNFQDWCGEHRTKEVQDE